VRGIGPGSAASHEAGKDQYYHVLCKGHTSRSNKKARTRGERKYTWSRALPHRTSYSLLLFLFSLSLSVSPTGTFHPLRFLNTAWWTDKTGERREQEEQGEDVVSGISGRMGGRAQMLKR